MLSFKNRFHGYNSLRFVYKNGRTIRSQYIHFRATTNPKRKTPRVAIVVSKKTCKSAVGRNRIRRRLYEIMRHHLIDIQPNTDIVLVVVSSDVLIAETTQLDEMVTKLLRQSNIYKSTH